MLSLQWRHLERAWDRSRFFDTHVRIETLEVPLAAGGTRSVEALVSEDPDSREIFDHIATLRLERLVFERGMGGLRQGDPMFPKIDRSENIPLPPQRFISLSENAATDILMDVYCVPVDDETQVFAGLPLKVWIRGYAFFERLAHDDNGNPIFECQKIARTHLLKELTRFGMTSEQSVKFTSLTTFQKHARDLYDAPLIRVSDGTYRFYSAAFHGPLLAGIVFSRIGSLNKAIGAVNAPTTPIQFEDKGHKFEKRVLNIFTDSGIPAKTFTYRIDKVNYDCDVAVLIEETLFVFECKNYNLPIGRVSELKHFLDSLRSFRKQVLRIAAQLDKHPEIVRQHFGESANWKQIIGHSNISV